MASLAKLRLLNLNINSCSLLPKRHGHHLRGKPPGIAKSLDQKLEEANRKDLSLHYRVDIGLPPATTSRTKQLQERLSIIKARKNNEELERLSRNLKLSLNLEEVKKDWLNTAGPHQIKQIADHYGVFEHLFGDAYFFPRVPLDVSYTVANKAIPVHYGNVIKPTEASQSPEVHYESDDQTLWTLVLTNPDGHFTQKDSEYVHWFVGNIPGNQINKGETLVQYLQPFPPKGTGYQRFIFILYKQEKKLDYSSIKLDGECLTLNKRTFSTYDFYRERQDDLTPAGLAFYQSDYDLSLKDFFHNKLQMKEPIFEYDFPPPYIRPQEWFPLRKPFNLYMDKYRDPKQINKEFLMRKLKNVHPFKMDPKPFAYPNTEPFNGYVPSWLKLEIKKSRLRWGRVNDIE